MNPSGEPKKLDEGGIDPSPGAQKVGQGACRPLPGSPKSWTREVSTPSGEPKKLDKGGIDPPRLPRKLIAAAFDPPCDLECVENVQVKIATPTDLAARRIHGRESWRELQT